MATQDEQLEELIQLLLVDLFPGHELPPLEVLADQSRTQKDRAIVGAQLTKDDVAERRHRTIRFLCHLLA